MISGRAILAGVIGDPVSHSLSPKLHNYWIEQLKLDAAYVPLHVKANHLPQAFRLLPAVGFAGWNVTVPHKEAALALVDATDETARAIGAINTIVVQKDGTLLGTNTDAAGFMANLKANMPNLSSHKTKAVILGAGGAARAVAKALVDEGFQRIVIVNRTPERAEALVGVIKGPLSVVPWTQMERALEKATLVVNTTTLGMQGQPPLELDAALLPVEALVADIVYRPQQTELMKAARAQGCLTIGGVGMLIRQAVPGFTAWFGVAPKVTPELEQFLLA